MVLLCAAAFFFSTHAEDLSLRILVAEGPSISLVSEAGFVLRKEGSERGVCSSEGALTVSADESGMLSVNGKKTTVSTLVITPRGDTCAIGTSTYLGAFICVARAGTVLCVNRVALEDYVYCVLRWESWPGWPLEVNQAFAIACRSYALATRKRARVRGALYDLRNTNAHQTYKGTHGVDHLREAVESTRGMIMLYDNEPIVAMYDSCCGGVIPTKMKNADVKKFGYLARSYPCEYCSNCKLYSWKVCYDHEEFARLIASSSSRPIAAIETRPDPAGIVREVRIKQGKSWMSLAGSAIYALCTEIKSFCFTIEKKAHQIIIQGRGFGHHLGLCQWGAREMARLGKTWREMLTFYYPGIRLGRITYHAEVVCPDIKPTSVVE